MQQVWGFSFWLQKFLVTWFKVIVLYFAFLVITPNLLVYVDVKFLLCNNSAECAESPWTTEVIIV